MAHTECATGSMQENMQGNTQATMEECEGLHGPSDVPSHTGGFRRQNYESRSGACQTPTLNPNLPLPSHGRDCDCSRSHALPCNSVASTLPRPLNPTIVLGYLTLCLVCSIYKFRYPKKGVGFKGLGRL